MSTNLLAGDTRMGAVTLRVADLDTMTAYYRDAVTLSVLAASGDEVVLGRGAEPILVLVRSPELQPAPSRSAGLFHTAILFDSEADGHRGPRPSRVVIPARSPAAPTTW